jgi:predicted HTH transcriptional regulator
MLKKEIEIYAENIWNYLDNNGRCSTRELRTQISMNDEEFLKALDRLLRKNMIVFNIKGKTGFIEQYCY